MTIVRDIPTMGHPDTQYGRVGNHSEIVFTDCRVPADHLIGDPGEGFQLAQQRLGGGRIHHSMRWLGQAQRSLDIMCERAVSRSSHGRRLADHQMIQDYIALSHMEIQAARLLTFQTAWKMDKLGASAVRADLGMIKAHVSKVVLGGARPHDPGVRCARLLGRPARSRVGTAPPGSARSATVPTSCTSRCWPARSCGTTSRSRAGRPSTSRAGDPRPSRSGRH